jgi:hypothetical protein
MKKQENKGHILVKLLVSVISVSALSTAALNIHSNAGQKVYYEDFSSMLSMQARSVFDRAMYHLKLAGYANSQNQEPIIIRRGALSDTLIVWHNDVEIMFFTAPKEDKTVLFESVDGSAKKLIEGVESIRFEQTSFNLITIELTLNHDDRYSSHGIISRSYSTTIKLENF